MGDQSQIQLHHHKRHHVHGRTLTPPKQRKIARKPKNPRNRRQKINHHNGIQDTDNPTNTNHAEKQIIRKIQWHTNTHMEQHWNYQNNKKLHARHESWEKYEGKKYSKPNSRNQLEHTNEHQPNQENKNPKYSMPSDSRMANHQHRETKGKILPHNIVRNTRDRKTSNQNITPIAYTQCKTPSTPKRKICTQNTIL